MSGATVGEIRARLVLDMNDWSRRQTQVRGDMTRMGRSAENLSKQMGLIQKASLAVGGAVVAGIGVSVKKRLTSRRPCRELKQSAARPVRTSKI